MTKNNIKTELNKKVQSLKHNYISDIFKTNNVKLIPENIIYLQNLLKSLSFIYVSFQDRYGTISDLFNIITDYNPQYIHIEDDHKQTYSNNDLCNEIYNFSEDH